MRGGAGIGQDKTIRGGNEDSVLQPRPMPSLLTLHTLYVHHVLLAGQVRPCESWMAQPAGTRAGSTLMGRILLGPIRNRVGYEFFKKKPRSMSGSGPGFIKKKFETRPETRP